MSMLYVFVFRRLFETGAYFSAAWQDAYIVSATRVYRMPYEKDPRFPMQRGLERGANG